MSTECIIVQGGKRLSGVVPIGGAKNSVLKLMAASLLVPGVTTITNVPCISDVLTLQSVLEHLGAEVVMDSNAHSVTIDAGKVKDTAVPYDLVAQMRATITVLGPLVGRFGKASIAMPGGCDIGARGIDMHLRGLEKLGVSFKTLHGDIHAHVGPKGLVGAQIELAFASVGATENLILAATCAKGTTVIKNAAREPEIADLADFLVCLGARISGQGTSVIVIEGVDRFDPVKGYATVGDRIEAGTFLVAGALAGGPLTVEGVRPEHLATALMKLEACGAEIATTPTTITVSHRGSFAPVDIQTLPYPGFPTDLQAQFMVLDAVASGSSTVTENIFESRFKVADEYNRMGARVRVEGHHAYIEGVEELSGAPVQAPDLRAGAGLVLAGLIADGTTRVSGVEFVDRGYEGIVEKLATVGAQITRETV